MKIGKKEITHENILMKNQKRHERPGSLQYTGSVCVLSLLSWHILSVYLWNSMAWEDGQWVHFRDQRQLGSSTEKLSRWRVFFWVYASICESAAAAIALSVLNLQISKWKRAKTCALFDSVQQTFVAHYVPSTGLGARSAMMSKSKPLLKKSSALGKETAVSPLKWYECVVHEILLKRGCLHYYYSYHTQTLLKQRKLRLAESTAWLSGQSIPEASWYVERNAITSHITRVDRCKGSKDVIWG